ncbi:50S ribosomal protein L11 methyltransferase [Propionivibrio sp.]|uniref:50S ribosomal protein L11 methyltransferase n=1 Tax=Propionivibrio sp. TaxID=2212460 RepID=UPI0025DB3B37|nr:50S ribosomal protein L11 methyltransferase [Propionivibrio sp.]MBK7355069.1 50S ribosomal protein L11 methyltransferase [Propionivibrio sp.]MBK8402439.1 50S ribosomal protein L11 methyltransferase [Propionivibrio sp.]MBK8743593.1 50S ribosomal protein L11 methyltransferase [Propionivibrio sp.]MBK8892897.1 50S ribosomal protein L11 methyltransferase [Propionivibrio sp.]
MAWLSASIETDSLHVEALADALMAAGALSVSIEDADAGTANETPQFGEPGSLSTPAWERSRIIALLEPDANVGGLIADCAQTAGLDNCPAFIQEEVAEQNWVQLTQSQFEPIRVSQGLWIVPSWHQAPDPDAIILVLDPGMAFGTGSHPTTRLCLEWLERSVSRGDSVLDYGCGSGILAIAANKLGATDVLGVDIDVQAIGAAKGNAERNNVSARFEDSSRGIRGQFDIVVANILSNPLKALAPAICAHVRSGGKLALSGILVEQAETLINTYAPFLPLGVADTRDGWVCLAGTKA